MKPEDKFNRDVAQRIRDARESVAPKLSQEEVGVRLGLSKVGYGHYERGTHALSAWQVVQLSRILGRSVEYILGLPTDLAPDEDRLLTAYRSIPDQGRRDLMLRIVEDVARQD
jgi:transcriptional regulator with XRE-family HTH domain